MLCVQEELLKKLIKGKDEDSFHRHLSGLDELLQDDNEMKELLDGSLAYAAYLDSNLQWRHLFRRVEVRNDCESAIIYMTQRCIDHYLELYHHCIQL